MMADPHSLIEGIIIASYAVRSNHAFIYMRGELVHAPAPAATPRSTRPTPPVTSARTSSAAASTSS